MSQEHLTGKLRSSGRGAVTRYIAQFVRGGFPELYAVMDTIENVRIGDPKPYHEANDEADARNKGTWGQEQSQAEYALGFSGWMAILPDKA